MTNCRSVCLNYLSDLFQKVFCIGFRGFSKKNIKKNKKKIKKIRKHSFSKKKNKPAEETTLLPRQEEFTSELVQIPALFNLFPTLVNSQILGGDGHKKKKKKKDTASYNPREIRCWHGGLFLFFVLHVFFSFFFLFFFFSPFHSYTGGLVF